MKNEGKRIDTKVLDRKRAQCGKQIVSQAATQLTWSLRKQILIAKEKIGEQFELEGE